jgi:hypothetical protein
MSETIHERALDAARSTLLDAGNPSFVLVVADGDRCALGPIVYSARGPAFAAAASAGSGTLIVGREAEGPRSMFSVWDASSSQRVLRRDEIAEKPIGGNELI